MSTPVVKRARADGINTPVRGNINPEHPNTPRTTDKESSSRIIELMGKRFAKQAEDMAAQFAKQNEVIAAQIQSSENKVLGELGEKLAEMRRELHTITERVVKLESAVSDIDHLKSEVGMLKAQLAKQENLAVACDLRLHGIPFTVNENLFDIFAQICTTINISPPVVKNIFRLNNGNNKDGIIIIKFATPYIKNFILKSISNFRRSNNDLLRLRHAGFNSDTPIYVNECLTKANHVVLQAAIGLKKKRQLSAAFTLRGLVHIKRTENETATRIESIEQLHSFIASTAVGQQNNNNGNSLFRSSLSTENRQQ